MTLDEELRWLRRGPGLTPARLAGCPAVMELLGATNFVDAHRKFVSTLALLGGGRNATALRGAYGVGDDDSVNLTARRNALRKSGLPGFKGQATTTLEDWENIAIVELATLLKDSKRARAGVRLLLPHDYHALTLILNLDSAGRELERLDGVIHSKDVRSTPLPVFDIDGRISMLPRTTRRNEPFGAEHRQYVYRAPDFHFELPERQLTFVVLIPGTPNTYPLIEAISGRFKHDLDPDPASNRVRHGRFSPRPDLADDSRSGQPSVVEFHWSTVHANHYYVMRWYWL